MVESVITRDGEQTMYDLTVDDAHTFAVGAGQWVVHNDCDFWTDSLTVIRDRSLPEKITPTYGTEAMARIDPETGKR